MLLQELFLNGFKLKYSVSVIRYSKLGVTVLCVCDWFIVLCFFCFVRLEKLAEDKPTETSKLLDKFHPNSVRTVLSGT